METKAKEAKAVLTEEKQKHQEQMEKLQTKNDKQMEEL